MFFGSLKSDTIRRHVAKSRFSKRKRRNDSGPHGRGITVVQAFGHETDNSDDANPVRGTTAYTHPIGTVRHHRSLSNVYYTVRDKLRRSDRSTEKGNENDNEFSTPTETDNDGGRRSPAANSGVEIDGHFWFRGHSMELNPTWQADGRLPYEQAPTLGGYRDLFHESGQWLSSVSNGLEQVAEDINREYSSPQSNSKHGPCGNPSTTCPEAGVKANGKLKRTGPKKQSMFKLFKRQPKTVSSKQSRPAVVTSRVPGHYIDTILETSLPMRAPSQGPVPLSTRSHYRAKVRQMCSNSGIDTSWMTEQGDMDWAYNGHLYMASGALPVPDSEGIEQSTYQLPAMPSRNPDDYFTPYAMVSYPPEYSAGTPVSEMESSSRSTSTYDPLPYQSIYSLYENTPPRKTSGYYR